MNSAIISIGSNIDPEQNIAKMLALMEKDCRVLMVSELVRTKPIGIEDQPDFVNGAALVETELTQVDFKQYLKSVEDALGRDRSLPKFGPRTMDLDIVVWNGEIVDEDYYTRDFLRDAAESLGFKKE
ncbi:2-amino-4-hydroxy-6-hydroxymethyldihydropteridine diphosphokinase [Mangrovibacterium diazotrophicum]|uniref:2-amino-4-hydroxy-6-hydroxymethyldihydropteridine pyrophosphokinase n=1 Tax=Mangrovibacterium diazotrophicum TaxID=1261403 RepID=A0A419WA45_9BACT|nr:2-amino-4-hydroxy-6-hydroxymethyldihydropteridine diphosphokinase [Mangrovibacterium diazotrophicum]RKD92350.1 2-amino-4-hydroxy-6-hydroxymethyldihydropteridine diphosphokinase [Mangrovibacterium diazotrophicum]